MVRLNVLLPSSTYDALRNAAARDCIPPPIKVIELLEDAIDDEEEELWEDFVESHTDTNHEFAAKKMAWL